MRKLVVSIERNGTQVVVGAITGNDEGEVNFSYNMDYLNSPDAAPISISLPLREEPYSQAKTRIFFEGLLPEGFTRRSVAQYIHTDEDDYLQILEGLGRECIGALRITDGAHLVEEPHYEKLTIQEVQALAREGATKSAQLVTEAHLSLTGASGKVGLYFNPLDQGWYLPKGDAPSTHILKQSHIRLDRIVANELLTMHTANILGVTTPETRVVNVGKGLDEDVLLSTRRYDRIIPQVNNSESSQQCVNSADQSLKNKNQSVLPIPLRLHQEDFCQALSIPGIDKYETRKEGRIGAMFRLLREYSANPLEDQLKLWDALVLHFLTGNTDGHLKNFSLLYDRNLRNLRLAPIYDIVSTTVYDSSTRDMAFFIGENVRLDKITKEDFRIAAKEAGIAERTAIMRLERMAENFPEALEEASQSLIDEGFTFAPQIQEKILKNGGIQYLRL